MNKTRIEWADYTINPIKGLCQQGCFYCYARKMYKRFKWNKEVRYAPEELNKIATIKEPSRIFICSTHDLFGEWIPDKWIWGIITELHRYPQHTFILLTKNAKRYTDWTFRKNFWLGETITEWNDPYYGVSPQAGNSRNIRFVSFEPLLSHIELSTRYIFDWIIVGAMTGAQSYKYFPEKDWVRRIVEQARELKVPLFLKNNLQWKEKIQEFPDA